MAALTPVIRITDKTVIYHFVFVLYTQDMWSFFSRPSGRPVCRPLSKRRSRCRPSALAAAFAAPILFVLAVHPTACAHSGIHEQIESVSRQIERADNDPDLYLRRGHLHLLHRAFQAALADFLNAGRHGGEARDVALALGQVYLHLGDLERALAHFDHCIALHPDHLRALDGWARTRLRAQQFLGAARDYERLIRLASDRGRPIPQQYLSLARAYASAGDQHFDAAILALDTGLSHLGPIRALQLEAVRIQTHRGRYDQAIRRISDMLEQSQRTESLLLMRGEIALRAGQWDAARNDFGSAIAAIDSLPAARRNTRLAQVIRNNAEAQLIQLGRRGPLTGH